MDEVTQQNSALVEQNAAAAKTLEQQAATMNERVAFFTLDESASAAPRHVQKPAAPVKPAPVQRAPRAATAANRPNGRGPVGRMQSALSTALKDDPDWKEF
jgi:methyl-accepting chemotaxis protein